MLVILIILIECSSDSLDSETIPKSGAPPNAMINSAAIFHKKSNKIYTIGGFEIESNIRTVDINSFDLTRKIWEKVETSSSYKPSAFLSHFAYISSNDQILIFSNYFEVFKFDLQGQGWSVDYLKGDLIKPKKGFAFTTFNFKGKEYAAIFGGIQDNTLSNNLHLIDLETLVARLIPCSSGCPFGQHYALMNFYEDSIYIYSSVEEYWFGNDEVFYKFDLQMETWQVLSPALTRPSYKALRYSCIYQGEFYLFFGFNRTAVFFSNEIYKYNIKNQSWALISNETGEGFVYGSFVQADNIAYFLYGRNSTNIKNSLMSIDLSTMPLKKVIITDDWVNPSARKFHCGNVMNTNMIIFAGMTETIDGKVEYFNDMWKFDLLQHSWRYVTPFGEIPEKRALFGCSKTKGSIFAVFGGKGKDLILDDLFIYYDLQEMWYQITPYSTQRPSKRYSSCLTYYNDTLFIIGGRNDISAFNDIWTYDFITNSFSSFKNHFNYEGLFNTNCWVEKIGNLSVLFIIGGENIKQVPNNLIIRCIVGSQSCQAEPFGIIHEFFVIGSETSVIVSDSFIIRHAGTLYQWMIMSNVVIYDRVAKNFSLYYCEDSFAGHSLVFFNKSLYVFGGVKPERNFYSYYTLNKEVKKIDLSHLPIIKCSPGTSGEKCSPCGLGTYWNDGYCNPCPAGKFNNYLASTSAEQCISCKQGFFSKKNGSHDCLECPSGFFCPIGSSRPRLEISRVTEQSIQPSEYQDRQGFISNISSSFWFISLGLSLLSLALLLVCIRLKTCITSFDLFEAQHSNNLGIPVVYRKTSLGGLFSIIFFLTCGTTVVVALLEFFMNNISENRALVPIVTLDSLVKASFFEVSATFYIYGGECENSSKKNTCTESLKITHEGLKFSKVSFKCFDLLQDCKIVARFENLYLNAKEVEIQLILEDSSSYAQSISLNLTSSSSIPSKISSVTKTVKPLLDNQVFKGPDPSIFYFKATPSVFQSQSSKWPSEETGFHITESKNAKPGSVSTHETLDLKYRLLLSVIITESDTAMITKRLIKQTRLFFIGSLLGSVFGLFGTFAAFLGFTENLSEVYEKRKNSRAKVRDVNMKIRKIKSQVHKNRNMSETEMNQNKFTTIDRIESIVIYK